MNSNEHKNRQTHRPYDTGRFALYLNEEPVTITEAMEDPEQEPLESPGYKYSAFDVYGESLGDGATLIPAVEVTDENRRDKFISGLIRRRYTADKVEAILLNGTDTEEHAAELAALQAYRKDCKEAVDELLIR